MYFQLKNLQVPSNEEMESAGVEEVAPENQNIERTKTTTLHNIVNFLTNSESGHLASEMSYVLKPVGRTFVM